MLARGEGIDVDFKRSAAGLEAVDIVAFANSKAGGAILIGVDESTGSSGRHVGTIVGCHVGDQEKRMILEKAHQCVPAISVTVHVENRAHKPFYRIEIPSGPNKPYCTSGGTYKIRGDGRNNTLYPTSLLNLFLETEERANRLKAELRRRGVHHDVLTFCGAELIQSNYFHAVFEATKSVADKIRVRSGLTGDGAALVDQAFGLGQTGIPFLALNSLQTDTERDEQKGLMNLIKGMFAAFRNVTAHAPKISWTVTEQDALDLLTIASLIHRRLDSAVRTQKTI